MRAVELFAGAGGMSLGLKRAGFNVVAAYDSWQAAVDIYRSNLGGYVRQADLKDIFRIAPEIVAERPDLIAGGPPCQDFSPAGDRVEGERAGLTRAFAMLVCVVRPKWFLMENVPQAANSEAWRDARAMLVKAGYGLTETKLNASFYGVPQARKRLFVIGKLDEADGYLESALVAARSAEATTVRDMLGDALGEAFYAHPRHPGKRGIWGVDEPAPTMRGSSRRPMPASYQTRPGDAALVKAGAFFTRPYYEGRGVRTLDEPAPAVIRTTRERPRPKYLANPHPGDPVPVTAAAVLTQEQVSRIQGFPSGWDWSTAGVRDVDQMIANAVPAALAEAIGRVILARDAGESIPEIQGRFGQWLRRSKGFNGQAVRNGKSRVNRARRLLGGRTFPDLAGELAALDAVEAFAALPTGTRSDLRKALRLYREWQEEPRRGRKAKATPPVEVEAVAA
ncbi:MAG: DNA (cytosine-5-)-methyltransferase [Mesorhizobium sp.]|nr:DNA (cytosine-5-)-methyltransferase [Mesorhizobium sp.]MBN9244288.1 DNA (cytosine-5-)-methyltransferase [Mesorhizobium sp.]